MGFEEAKSLLAKLTEEINSQGNPEGNPDGKLEGNPEGNPEDNPDGADDLSAIKEEIIKLQNSINDMTKQKTALEKENAQLRRKNTELATKTSIPQKSTDEMILNLCDTRRVRKD